MPKKNRFAQSVRVMRSCNSSSVLELQGPSVSCRLQAAAAPSGRVISACTGCAQLSMVAWCIILLDASPAGWRIRKAVERSRRRFRCSASFASAWFAFPAGGASDGTRLSRLVLPCLSTGSGMALYAAVMPHARRTAPRSLQLETCICISYIVNTFLQHS